MTKLFSRRASNTFSLCLASLLILASQPGILRADTVNTDEWQIEADKVLRFENPKSIIAEGNVVLTKQRRLPPRRIRKSKETSSWSVLLEEEPSELTSAASVTQMLSKDTKPRYKTEMIIKADWIAYDIERNSIKVKGDVSVSNNADRLLAKEGQLDLTTETGSFKEATIQRQSLDLHLEGKRIVKTGAKTYQIQDGWLVTCKVKKGETPPWSFAAKETLVTQGEYATFKHATFRIKGVPVLYTPWLKLPIGNKRQSGVLFPEISSSKQGGFGLNVPYFINLSDSSDITIYPEFFVKRGVMPGLEARYILGARDKGTFMANYLSDELSDPSETEYRADTGYTHTNKDRYWLRGKLDQEFDNTLITRIDLDIVSDRDYLTEFNSGLTGFQESNAQLRKVFGRSLQNKTNTQRNNSLKLLKTWNGMALEGVFLGINDVRKRTSSPTPLWKLPSLDFTGSVPLGESPLTLNWDSDFVNYYRENGVGGQRLDIYPRISAPLPLGPYLESRSQLAIRETFYNVQTFGDGTWDKEENQNRFLGEFNTEIGTTLLRDFALDLGETQGITHKLRPYVKYDFLSESNQDQLPRFDAVDRRSDKNEITYGLDNFFDLFGQRGEETINTYYGYLKIKQSYDLRSERSDNPLSPVNLKLTWLPLTAFKIIYKTDIDVYGEGVTNYGLETYYSNSRGDFLNIDYRFNKSSHIEQLNVTAKAQLYNAIFASYAIEHSISESKIIAQNVSLIYQPACWSIELKSNYTPGDHIISVLFNLANIGNPLGLRM